MFVVQTCVPQNQYHAVPQAFMRCRCTNQSWFHWHKLSGLGVCEILTSSSFRSKMPTNSDDTRCIIWSRSLLPVTHHVLEEDPYVSPFCRSRDRVTPPPDWSYNSCHNRRGFDGRWFFFPNRSESQQRRSSPIYPKAVQKHWALVASNPICLRKLMVQNLWMLKALS